MRSVLFGRKHGKTDWQLIAGPNLTTSDQIILRAEIMKDHPVNDTWAEVEMWSENHIKGRLKFVTTEQSASNAEQKLKDDASIASTRAEAEERQRVRDEKEAAENRKRHQAEVEKLNKVHDAAREGFAPTSRVAAKALERLNQSQEAAAPETAAK